MTSSTALTFTPWTTEDLYGEDSTADSEKPASAPHHRQLLLAGALAAAALWALKNRRVAQDPQNPTMNLSQADNNMAWWLNHSDVLRRNVIASTSSSVGAALSPTLNSAVNAGIRGGLSFLTGPITRQSTYSGPRSGLKAWRFTPDIREELANSSAVVGRGWSAAYARKLGEGLGNASADGLLVSMSTLNRASLAEDVAWRVLESVAGLPHGDALSTTQVAINRLHAYMGTRKPISTQDVGKDIGKLLLSRRAKRIIENEDMVARNFGTQILLMNAVSKGYLPADAEKVWVTAVDERVCPVCAPMDSVAVKINEPFHVRGHSGVLSHDVKLWVPPAHPLCRCRVVPSSAIEHGIITRSARFSRANPTESEWPIPAKFDQSRARARSDMKDVVHQAQTPTWMADDVKKGWAEALHPRGSTGKFVAVGAAGVIATEAYAAYKTHQQTKLGYAMTSGLVPRRKFRTVKGVSDAPLGTKITKATHKQGTYLISTASLTPYRSMTSIKASENPAALYDSITRNGFTHPVHMRVYSDGAQLWDGNHRLNVAEDLGVEAVPVKVVHMAGRAPKALTLFARINVVRQRRYRARLVARANG